MAYDGWIITTPPPSKNATPINIDTLKQVAGLLGVTDVSTIKETQITTEALHAIANLLGVAKPTNSTSTTILIRQKG